MSEPQNGTRSPRKHLFLWCLLGGIALGLIVWALNLFVLDTWSRDGLISFFGAAYVTTSTLVAFLLAGAAVGAIAGANAIGIAAALARRRG